MQHFIANTLLDNYPGGNRTAGPVRREPPSTTDADEEASSLPRDAGMRLEVSQSHDAVDRPGR